MTLSKVTELSVDVTDTGSSHQSELHHTASLHIRGFLYPGRRVDSHPLCPCQ